MPGFTWKRRRAVFTLFLFSAMAFNASSPSEPDRVRVAIISPSWIMDVAHAKGFFQREHLQVQTTVTGSSGKQIQALIDGEFDIGHQATSHIIRAIENGADLTIFLGGGGKPQLSLIVHTAIKSYGDLKGKLLVVDALRTGYTYILKRMLAHHGLQETDYGLEAVGNSSNRYAAIKEGRAAGALLSGTISLTAVNEGFRQLDTAADYIKDYQASAAAVKKSWAKAHEDVLIRYIRAYVAASDWLCDRRNKNQAVEILLATDASLSQDLALKSYDLELEGMLPKAPFSWSGMKAVMEEMAQFGELKTPLPPAEKYVDLTYYEKAVK